MPPAGSEPAIPADDRPQTLALDRSDTGMDSVYLTTLLNMHRFIALIGWGYVQGQP
jgi:hypothetical protein